MSTNAAHLASVSGINENHRYASKFGLVGQKLFQLREGPVGMSRALPTPNSCPGADAFEILKGNPTFGALRGLDDLLRDAVICVPLKASLSARQRLEPSLTAACADGLKFLAAAVIPLSCVLNLRTGEVLSIGCGGKIHNAKVNSEPAFCIIGIGCFNFTSLVNVEVAIAKDKLSTAQAVFQHLLLMLATNEGNVQAAFDAVNGNLLLVVGLPREILAVVRKCSERFEAALGLAVKFVGVSHLCDRSHSHLGRERELLTSIIVDQLMQVILAKRLGLPGPRADPVAGGVSCLKCPLENGGLFGCSLKFELDY